MSAEIDDDLVPELWETLKALRAANSKNHESNRLVASLVELQLVKIIDDVAAITPRGRSVLLRGSPRLWDVAA